MSFKKNGLITADIQDCDYVDIPMSFTGFNKGTFTQAGNLYTITSPIESSDWGRGIAISAIKVPYGCWYEASMEIKIPTAHNIQVDINNYFEDKSTPNGNDNDLSSVRGFIGSKSIAANTWTSIKWYTQNARDINVDKLALCVYDGLGVVTTNDTESIIWQMRNPKFRIYYNRNQYCSIGDGIIYPKNLIET